MKKEEKIRLLEICATERQIARVYFKYDQNYYYFYPDAVTGTFLLAQEEDDFQLDGFHIRKMPHVTKVEIKDDLCAEINVWNGVAEQVERPEIDLSSWVSIFTDLQKLPGFLIIEDEINGQFVIGKIEKVCRRQLLFRHFDADGVWTEAPYIIPYSSITHVAWNTRYANNWAAFLASRANG